MASNGDQAHDNAPEPGRADPARLDRLEQQIAELRAIVTAQQAPAPAGEHAVTRATAPPARQRTVEPVGENTLTYAGNVPAGNGRMVTSQRRTLEDVLTADPDLASRVFAALASPARITLLKTLLGGPRSTQQLRGVLDDPSVGQLYHHLKELLAAGLVIQPGRSNYALRRGSQIELCILIAAAASLAAATSALPPDPGQPPGSEGPPGEGHGSAARRAAPAS